MPGEYILGVVRNVNVNHGEFKNIAITNHRLILFNSKTKRSFLKSSTEITKMHSLPFDNACGVEVIVGNSVLTIIICPSLWVTPSYFSCKGGAHGYGISISIEKTLTGPSLTEVSNKIMDLLSSIAKEVHHSDHDKRSYLFILQDLTGRGELKECP
ncbi:hypothetical protein [Thermococcus sp.]